MSWNAAGGAEWLCGGAPDAGSGEAAQAPQELLALAAAAAACAEGLERPPPAGLDAAAAMDADTAADAAPLPPQSAAAAALPLQAGAAEVPAERVAAAATPAAAASNAADGAAPEVRRARAILPGSLTPERDVSGHPERPPAGIRKLLPLHSIYLLHSLAPASCATLGTCPMRVPFLVDFRSATS